MARLALTVVLTDICAGGPMALGMTPLIPLNRVVPDPNARFERFGQNNDQLFGKPMITTGGLSLLAQTSSTTYSAFQAAAPQQSAQTDLAAAPGQNLAAPGADLAASTAGLTAPTLGLTAPTLGLATPTLGLAAPMAGAPGTGTPAIGSYVDLQA
jgi:hypothetical protein